MMSKTIAIGRLVRDPRMSEYGQGSNKGKLAAFTIAVNYGKDKTAYYDCVAFQKTAEIIERFLAQGKGRLVSVEGIFQNNNTERQGVKNYGMNLNVDRIVFLDSPNESQKNNTQPNRTQPNTQSRTQNPSTQSPSNPSDTASGFDGFDSMDGFGGDPADNFPW